MQVNASAKVPVCVRRSALGYHGPMQPSLPTVSLLALAVRLPWQWAVRLASLAWRAACLGVLMISPASYRAPYGNAIASRLVVDTLPLLAGYAAFSALLSLVITRIVVTTAVTYGLTQYAMEVVIRMLVLEIIPLAAALLVALRVAMPNSADVSRARRRGELEPWRARGVDPLGMVVMPRVVSGMFSSVLLAVMSSVITLVVAYLTVYGFSLAGLPTYVWMFGKVFTPAVTVVFFLKTLLFSLAVALLPMASALDDDPNNRSRTVAELQAIVRLLVTLLMIEVASLASNYI
jgi:phospholipid/cholesterol/gamma-HCH transport system permease protein